MPRSDMDENPEKANIETPPENVGRTKENSPATLEPPPDNGGQQKSKV